MKRLYSFLLVTLVSFATLKATIPVIRTRSHVQTDGTSITVKTHVQGTFLIYSTSDGFAVLPNADGDYTYALLTQDGFSVGNVVAHEPADRTLTEQDYVRNKAHLATVEIHQTFDPKTNNRHLKAFNTNNADGTGIYKTSAKGTLPSIGSPTIPVIMVDFPDEQFLSSSTKEEVEKMFNQEGYTDLSTSRFINGSVADFFKSQSDGLFIPTFKIVTKVTAKHGYAYYGANVGSNNSPRAHELVEEVINTAQTAGNNFSEFYVANQNGVPLVVIYFAGSGEQNSFDATKSNRLWAHYNSASTTAGGQVFNSYFVGNEQFFTYKTNDTNTAYLNDSKGNPIVDSTKTRRDGIGLLCHELSHALGLPDFYTTYGVSHSKPTPDFWSLMDYGCYWAQGYAPMGYNAYERNVLGWLKLHDLSTAQACDLYPYGSDADKPMAYRIVNPSNSREYIILENRTRGTWSPANLSGGILATHVSYNASTWLMNRVNNNANAMGFQIVAADGEEQMAEQHRSTWLSMYRGDLYPGTSNVTEVASWNVYTGGPLEKPIYNIKYDTDSHMASFSYLDRNLVTNITSIEAQKETTNAPIYDLQGRRVTTPTRGLYIVNGRKVLFR